MPSRPPEHHLPIPLFPLCLQNTSAIRDRLRGPCDALIYFLRFLRFLRNDLSEKTLNGSRWLEQAKDINPQSKSSSRLSSLCSTQRHKGVVRQTLPYYGERNPCVAGNPVSHHQSPTTKYARTAASCSCARSAIRATRSQCGVPQPGRVPL
jgi:hypothetical protein